MGRVLVVSGLILLAAGCGSGERSFSSSDELRVSLNEAHLFCIGYRPIRKAVRQWDMDIASDVGKCKVDGESVRLVIFKDDGQKDEWAVRAKQFGCTVGKNFGVPSYDYVDGGAWAITNASRTLTVKIADTIGGTAVHVDCNGFEEPTGSILRILATGP